MIRNRPTPAAAALGRELARLTSVSVVMLMLCGGPRAEEELLLPKGHIPTLFVSQAQLEICVANGRSPPADPYMNASECRDEFNRVRALSSTSQKTKNPRRGADDAEQ